MLEVKAAYGREYKNQKQIRDDWNKNLDFQTFFGQYINKPLAETLGEIVVVRYGKNFEKVVGV